MPSENEFEKLPTNKVRRSPRRGHYDKETVYRVIDQAWLGHVGIVDETSQEVAVIPMLHARDNDELIFHGATSSRLMKHLGSGRRVSISFTMVDGIVLAKSLYHHSMNYRSAVVFGTGSIEENESRKIEALKVLSEKLCPGRWQDARQPNAQELTATAVVRLKIESASAKIRVGPPIDDKADLELPVWSGVLPINETLGDPIADQYSKDYQLPEYL